MTYKEQVIKFMSSIRGRTPILLLERAAKIFNNIYSGRVYDIKNEEDLLDLENMTTCKISKPVVIKDLSELYNDEDILKFIEENNLQLILLAYKDNLSDTLMSRCKTFLKLPDIDINECKYTNKKSALSAIENMAPDLANSYLMENCPALMRDRIDTQFLKYKERLVNILANMEGGMDEQ